MNRLCIQFSNYNSSHATGSSQAVHPCSIIYLFDYVQWSTSAGDYVSEAAKWREIFAS